MKIQLFFRTFAAHLDNIIAINSMSYQFSKYETHYRNLTYLGVPIIIGQLGNLILNFADTLMIGHHSTKELAAAAFVNNMFTLVIIFAVGFTYAITALVGTLYGQEKTHRIGELMKKCSSCKHLYGCVFISYYVGIVYQSWEFRTAGGAVAPYALLLCHSACIPSFCLLV